LLTVAEMQLGRGETIADTARVLSRYVDAIMIRILTTSAARACRARYRARHQRTDAALASLPGDGRLDDVRGASRPDRRPHVAWTGDDNNVAGLLGARRGAVQIPIERRDPPQLAPNKAMKEWIKATQAPIMLGSDPESAVRGADCVVTTPGSRWRQGRRASPQCAETLSGQCKTDVAGETRCAVHALPPGASRRRGPDEVIDGPQSV